MHRELTVLHKQPSPCRAELLRVSSPTNSTNTSARRGREGAREAGMEGGREGDRERGRERELIDGA